MDDVTRLIRLVAEQGKTFAMLILDPEGRILWFSPGAERVFGVSSRDAVGRRNAFLFTKEDVQLGIPELEIAIARASGTAEDDRWLARPDGSRFWATGAMISICDEAGTVIGFAKILRNRTDLKEQLETLRQQLEASDVASRRKDVFLSTLSHELRNPLAPLSHAVQIIRMTTSVPELEPTLRIIERQIETLRRLVDDLLDITRIGIGKVELIRKPVAIQDVLHRALESARPAIRERRHDVEALFPPAPILVDADVARLEQVFVNLIRNAAKYTPEGGRIVLKATTEGREAVVYVEDNGVGIPHDMLPRIFDLFTQVETSRHRSEGGLGIGLSLVKELVTLHGGTVQVQSDGPGRGSQFSVRLPLHRDS